MAGPEATFVFTRSDDTHASTCFRWADRPGFAVLARALGMPAFSLTARPFVVIESEDGWERDLVERLMGMRGPSSPRYLAVGGKDAVAAVLRAVRPLVADAGGRLRVGGIVDRDHDEGSTVQGFNPDEIHVLGCHDLENLFLHPDAIDSVQPRSRRNPEAARATVRDASDRFAGVWIVERTQSRHRVPREWFDLGTVKGRDWSWWSLAEGQLGEAISKPGVAPPPDHVTALLAAFAESIGAYRSLRISDDLWRFCSGKEVLGHLPRALGLRSKREIIDRVIDQWEHGGVEPPADLENLRHCVAGL